MHQEAEETEVAIKEFNVVRSKIFSFHSARSVIIAKVRTKSKQTCVNIK